MSVLEKEIEGKVVAWAKKQGFLTPKVKFVEAGYPDRLFISPKGHTIFIEFKVPGGKPDPLQDYRLRTLRARNIPAVWTDSVVEGINILKAALEPASVSREGDTYDAESGGSGVVLRPRFGEDIHSSGGATDPATEEDDQQGADSRTPEGG